MSSIRWEALPFAAMSVDALYAAIQLREAVFVVEQDCPYLDCDGLDTACTHVLGWLDDALVATARVLPAGVKYSEASIGRVVVHPDTRGSLAGQQLMQQAIAVAEQRQPGCAIRISAQAHLQRFYERLGFVRQSDTPYLEDNIPHIEMLRPEQPAQQETRHDLMAASHPVAAADHGSARQRAGVLVCTQRH